MSVNDWDGTRALTLLRERMNRLFDDRHIGGSAVDSAFAPPTDVYATADHVVITVELPGVTADDVTIGLTNGDLTLSGRRAFQRDGAAYHRLERSYGDFRCAVSLPPGADPARRATRFEDGVLTIEI